MFWRLEDINIRKTSEPFHVIQKAQKYHLHNFDKLVWIL